MGDDFVSFSLVHSGSGVPLRDWHGNIIEFDLVTAKVEDGMALAQGSTVTLPLTATTRANLADLWVTSFRGRPLQGWYTLRIWESNGLRWGNVEDIELILNHSFWTSWRD
jgi:hypothetical protein